MDVHFNSPNIGDSLLYAGSGAFFSVLDRIIEYGVESAHAFLIGICGAAGGLFLKYIIKKLKK